MGQGEGVMGKEMWVSLSVAFPFPLYPFPVF
jgi:hypothetical protein